MTTAVLSPSPVQRFFDNNGLPLVAGLVNTYQAGTTTPVATYTDSTAATPNPNPIVLDFRGEAPIWLLPNVLYKYVITDSNGNAIRTVDNISVSQLLTLYGGVDSGAANSYVLSFTANFTSLVDGIYIVWIPSHTNTMGSTINVNGLGVLAIQNPDGSALTAGEIVANIPAIILYKGGVWQLLSPTTTIYQTFTGAWSGFSAAPASAVITYRKNSNVVTLLFSIQTGTSNATTFRLTGLPASLTPSVVTTQTIACPGMVDNGANVSGASCAQVNSAGWVDFFKDSAGGGWTNSGAKGFWGNTSLTYSL